MRSGCSACQHFTEDFERLATARSLVSVAVTPPEPLTGQRGVQIDQIAKRTPTPASTWRCEPTLDLLHPEGPSGKR